MGNSRCVTYFWGVQRCMTKCHRGEKGSNLAKNSFMDGPYRLWPPPAKILTWHTVGSLVIATPQFPNSGFPYFCRHTEILEFWQPEFRNFGNEIMGCRNICRQRRQSGSKSGGRESGRRNFRFQSNKFPIFRKFFPIFPAKILTTFLVVSSTNFLFSVNIHVFTFSTYILSKFFSFFF